ncbi:tRNA methyltransferase 10 [Rhizophlyctis rosea]|nr:tRNA methyltransferase 10 [Rhizophlyctis rosea]
MVDTPVPEPPQAVAVESTAEPSQSNSGLSASAGTSANQPQPPLSKKAQKRLLKEQKWEAGRDARKEARRAKRTADRQKYRENVKAGLVQKRPPRKKPQTATSVTVAIDLQFQHLMSEKEVKSTALQIAHSYAQNNKASNRLNLALTSFKGSVKEALNRSYPTFVNWKIQSEESDYYVVWDPAKIVYLSADAEDTLTDLEDDTVYMIGGIVDKNRFPNLCFKDAQKHNCRTAKLPVDQHIDMRGTRKVLTTNHVFEILSKFMDTKDWRSAIYEVIPQRKGIGAALAAGGAAGSDGVEVKGEVYRGVKEENKTAARKRDDDLVVKGEAKEEEEPAAKRARQDGGGAHGGVASS